MKALVTGSTGFVGANLVEGLAAAGHEVRALHRSSSRLDALAGLAYEYAVGDILEPASLKTAMEGVDWVFHVAAVSDYWRQNGAAWLYRVNVGGTRNVLEAALSTGVRRVVFTSSAASLGIPTHSAEQVGRPLDESATFNIAPALLPYGHSKHLAEHLVHEFVDRGLEVVIVNPTVILGPRDLNMISGSAIIAVYRRQAPAVPAGGVNYVDVADVAAGHIAAAERGRVGERYILGAHNLTHQRASEIMAEVVGVKLPPLHMPRVLMDPFAVAVDLFNRFWPYVPLVTGSQVRLMKHMLFFDTSKAQRELNLGPPIPFRTSVERTFRWYRDNGYV